jgi:hypothetical protein
MSYRVSSDIIVEVLTVLGNKVLPDCSKLTCVVQLNKYFPVFVLLSSLICIGLLNIFCGDIVTEIIIRNTPDGRLNVLFPNKLA